MHTLLVSLAVLSLFSAAAFAGDDAGIKARIDQFQEAWNKNDTAAMAALWTEDGSLINPAGRVGNNRAEVEKIFVDEHAAMLKDTKYETQKVTVQWVTADVAVADVTGNITNVHGNDGAALPDYPHHVVWVFVKKGDTWMAAAARPYQYPAKPAEAK